jgi:TolB-like protein/Tfp pilus assembly protein PilF
MLIGAAAMLMLLAGAAIWYRGRSVKPAARPAIQSIAVLPLKNLSGDPSQEYLADGMTEELIGRLSEIHGLRVISRTSVMRFKDAKLSVPEIAKTMKVESVVEGSVIRDGNRIRVHAQLIRGDTDEHLWANAYDRQIQDVLTLESEVTKAIADQIRVELTPQQQARLNSAREVNPQAYESYLKGRFFLQMSPTLQVHKNAERYFREAIQKDPSFALAYAGLADCYLDFGAFRWMRPQDAYRLGDEAIQNAIKLDGTLSEAHASLGYLHWQYDWDWEAAEKELRYALELNPNNVDGREGLIWYLAWSGRGKEARAELDKIRAPDPAYPLGFLDEAGIDYHMRDYKALMESSHRALDSDPNNWPAHYFLAVSRDGLGCPTEAVPEYRKAVELSQGDTDALAGLAHAYAFAGKRTEAAKILREMQQQSKAQYISPYMLATIYAALGNKDTAFAFLEKAYQERSPAIPYFLKADLRLDPLRSDPRFKDLQRRVGLD